MEFPLIEPPCLICTVTWWVLDVKTWLFLWVHLPSHRLTSLTWPPSCNTIWKKKLLKTWLTSEQKERKKLHWIIFGSSKSIWTISDLILTGLNNSSESNKSFLGWLPLPISSCLIKRITSLYLKCLNVYGQGEEEEDDAFYLYDDIVLARSGTLDWRRCWPISYSIVG